MCDCDKNIINKLSIGIIFMEKTAASDTQTKESNIVKKLKKMIENEVK
ncbi:hypothetical protein [Clostridium novyi]|nr:hypothetical protein [Clostridium novyi]